MTTIVLADDHPLLLRGLKGVLAAEPDLQVVGEARDGAAALLAIEQLKPDVAVLDLMMPGLGGLEVIRRAARGSPGTRMVITSTHAGESYVIEALRAGARGYVLKECTDTDLARAVREVAAGGRYLSHPLSDRALDSYRERAAPAERGSGDALTLRERQVVELVAQDRTDVEIAEGLGLSPHTVEAHRGKLMRKLGLETAADLVRYAVQAGLMPAGPGTPGT